MLKITQDHKHDMSQEKITWTRQIHNQTNNKNNYFITLML